MVCASCPCSAPGARVSCGQERTSSMRAREEPELGESPQLPDLRREHLQLAAHEVELSDAVTAPRDAFPQAWTLVIRPPLLQRRARRPHRPQRGHVRLCSGATTLCLLHDVSFAAAVGGGHVAELGSGLDGLVEPVGKEFVAGDVADDTLEEGGHRQRVREQEGVQLAWSVLARLDDEEACVGLDGALRRLSVLGAWGEDQLRAVFEVEVGEG
eukprot:scaffold63493_cov69-Phaeocystis_antarctica.AAC.3